jgi:hypothetical protein
MQHLEESSDKTVGVEMPHTRIGNPEAVNLGPSRDSEIHTTVSESVTSYIYAKGTSCKIRHPQQAYVS